MISRFSGAVPLGGEPGRVEEGLPVGAAARHRRRRRGRTATARRQPGDDRARPQGRPQLEGVLLGYGQLTGQ